MVLASDTARRTRRDRTPHPSGGFFRRRIPGCHGDVVAQPARWGKIFRGASGLDSRMAQGEVWDAVELVLTEHLFGHREPMRITQSWSIRTGRSCEIESAVGLMPSNSVADIQVGPAIARQSVTSIAVTNFETDLLSRAT